MTFPFYAEVNANSSILIELTVFCVACYIAMIQGQGSYRLLQSLYFQDGHEFANPGRNMYTTEQ